MWLLLNDYLIIVINDYYLILFLQTSSAPQFSYRGKGKCPQCNKLYTNRYKPKVCQCGFVLGGSFTPRHVKKPKLDVPACTEVVSGPWSIYSCKTSTHDDRCLVIKDQRDGRLNALNMRAGEITRTTTINHYSTFLFAIMMFT